MNVYRRSGLVFMFLIVFVFVTGSVAVGQSNVFLPLMGGSGPAIVSAAADTIDLPAGEACDFDISVDIVGNWPQAYMEFYDENDNLVRMFSAGKGNALTFTNVATGDTVFVKPSGSVQQITFNPDGSLTVMETGHTVLILYPSDVPPGPSTTAYVGRIVYTIDTSGVWTLQETHGKSTDICEALSPSS